VVRCDNKYFFYYSLLDQIVFYETVLSMSILKTLNQLYSNYFMEFLKNPSLVLYSWFYAPLLSVLSYLIQQQTITSQLLSLFSALDLSFISSNTEFLIFGLPQQLSKLNNPNIHLPNNNTLSPVDSTRNLGVLLIKICYLYNISAVYKSCLHNIHDLRRIRITIDQTTAYLSHSF